nr:type IV toxin-antitoxin system AbiEi family antitoxin domain-containing protein [Hoyosella altamirensis]
MDLQRVQAIMAHQDGVIRISQALGAGMSRDQIHRRVESGEWVRLHQGVYLHGGRSPNAAAWLRAAVYSAGPSAVARSLSAAWWHGLLTHPPRQHFVAIPAARRVRHMPHRHVRHRNLLNLDTTTVRSLRVTCIPLTILEAAVDHPEGSMFMDRALQKHASLHNLWSVHERNPGRAGAKAAETLLRAAGEGGASEAERMLTRLLRRSGISGWKAHVHALGYEIDVAFPLQRVAIEVDGWAWHRDAKRFKRDMDRQNALVNAGWHVLRFTWHHLMHEPDRVVKEITAALANRPTIW